MSKRLAGNPGPVVAAGGVANLTNTGRLVKNGANAVSTIGANVINSGTASVIAVTSGQLRLSGATNTLGGVVSGTLALAAGTTTFTGNAAVANIAVIGGTLALGATLRYAGSFTETAGAVQLAGDSLILSGPAALASTITSTGTVITRGTTTLGGLLLGGGEAWINQGVADQAGFLALGNGGGAVQLTNQRNGTTANTGILDIAGDFSIGFAAGGSGSITNGVSAVFAKTAGAGASVIAPDLANTGTIEVATGTLDLQGTVAGAGTLGAARRLQKPQPLKRN